MCRVRIGVGEGAFVFRVSFTPPCDTCTALESYVVSFRIRHLRHVLNILLFINEEYKSSMQFVALISMNQGFVLLPCNLYILSV